MKLRAGRYSSGVLGATVAPPPTRGVFRVLILEDRVADAELCERELRRAGLQFESRRVDTRAALEAELERFSPDLILADFTLPGGFDGLAALELARRKAPEVPFVFVSGTIGEERAVEAIKQGAADYVLKDRMARLGPAVQQVLKHSRLRKEIAEAEAAMRESEGKYRELIEQASDGIFVTDRDGNFLLANSRYREMLGYGEDELAGLSIADTYPAAEREGVPARLAQPANAKRRVFERLMLRKDGSTFPVEISVKFLANGIHQGVVRDISERKRAEAAQRMSEEMLRATFDQAGVGMGLRSLDPLNPRWLRVNQKLCDILGYTREELLQLTSVDITPPDERPLAIAYNDKLLRGEVTSYSRQKRYLRKDGRIIWAEVCLTAIRTPEGRPNHVVSVIHDITDRKAMEAALTESESQFRAFMRYLPGRASMRDLEGRYAFINDSWLRAFGLTEKTVVGHAPEEIFPAPRAAALKAAHREALETGRPVTRVFSVDSAGRPQWWFATHFPIAEPGGRATMVGTISLDITEQKLREDKVEKLSRVRTVTSETNAAIVRSKSRQELFAEACRIAAEHGGLGMVWIGLLDPATLDVTPAAWAGFDADDEWTTLMSTARDIPAGQGSIGRAIREKKPVVVDDMAADAAVGGMRRQRAVARGYRSAIALPLLAEGEVIGTFSLFAKEAGYFDDEEVELLTELAGNISFALGSMARQEKIERLSRIRALTSGINGAIVRCSIRQELFDEACGIAVEHGNFGLAWIGAYDPETLDITPVAAAGLGTEEMKKSKATARADVPQGQGVLGRAVRERRPVFDNDISKETGVGGRRRQEALRLGYRSLIVLPLHSQDRVTGIVSLFAREPGFFDEEEVSLLAELAGNLSFALENMARQERLAKLSRVRAVSSEINAAIVRSHSQQELFDETCRIAVQHGGFGIAWVGILDPATLDITPTAFAGLAAEEFLGKLKSSARSDHPQGQGVAGVAIRERRVVISNDLLAETGALGDRRNEAIRRGYQSRIALPLHAAGEIVGVIVLYAIEKDFFTEDELNLLTELAGNVSFALEHIARQEKIEKLSRIRALSSEINAAIVRVHDRQPLLEELCRISSEHGKFGFVWVATVDAEKQEVRPVAWTGFSGEAANAVSWRTISSAQGTLGEAMQTCAASFRNDIEAQLPAGKLRQEALQQGCLSTVCLPLVVDGKVTALVSLFAAGRWFFDEDELALLNELAGNLSFALEHIAKQQKIEKLSRTRAVSSSINSVLVRVRDRQELLQQSCRVAVENGQFPFAWIGILDPATQDVTPVAWSGEHAEELTRAKSSARDDNPRGRGAVGLAIRERRVVVNDDIAARHFGGSRIEHILRLGFRSQITLPLFEEKTVIGTLTIYAREPHFFDEEEISLLTELAGDISFALEHIARQEKIEKLSRIRAVLGEINAAILRIRDKQELFDEACRIAVEAGGFPFAYIGIVDRDAKRVRPVAAAGDVGRFLEDMHDRRSLDETAPQGHGPSVRSVLEKKAVVANDIQNDPRILRKQEHLERNINSLAVLPLLVGDQAVGVLALHAKEVGFFDAEEIELLSGLAGDIAFALQTIEKQEKLDYLSYYDVLTGLPNRTLFIDRSGQQMRSRSGEPLMVALVLINIERFRNINEAFGRRGGDELLTLVAQRLENTFNGKDYLARVGADGFGVVIRGIRDAAAVVHAVENQILGCFRQPFKVGGSELRVAAKAGIAMFPADGSDADTLFKNAEAALKNTRDSSERYLFYAADMNARAAQALSLETRLRTAVEARQFVLHYQPKIDLAKDTICGLEALIRWQEPGGALVPPGAFIPLLEETGLILEVGKWALARALMDHSEWTARGCNVPRIAVNVSAIQLLQKDFSDMVINVVHEQGRGPDALELEVTESLLMKDVEGSIRKLSILRGLGIYVAMDDFGTGYSSLSYIARLPINSIKIDRSFITGLTSSPQDMAIVTTIIALAHSLNLRVVAEGVETESQSKLLKLLKLLKCDEAQGYLFSKPIPAPEIERLLLTLPPKA